MIDVIVKQCRPAVMVFLLLLLITGVVYPTCITLIGHLFFTDKAEGSLIIHSGKIVGSKLIGQYFSADKYFWGRPSATANYPYNTMSAHGSNLGPTNIELKNQVAKRIAILRGNRDFTERYVPIDLVTTSGSGLDPHISPRSADVQIHRVARARGLTDDQVRNIMLSHIERRQWYFLGEPRINVLQLNLDLDNL